jgi:hypothetical protein
VGNSRQEINRFALKIKNGRKAVARRITVRTLDYEEQQMYSNKIHGVVWAFNPAPNKMIGSLIDSTSQRFHFQASRVISGPTEIKIGMYARFVIIPMAKITPGRLPVAHQIEISDKPFASEISAGAASLAAPFVGQPGQNGDGGVK